MNFPNKRLTIAREMPVQPFLRLFKAVCVVESGNDPRAYNSASKATGIVQITPILLKDYNARSGKSYKLKDCYNIKISRNIFFFYCMKIPRQDFERIARRWNGRGSQTEKYWQLVKKQLKKN
jgi:hypothetical protein